MKSEEGLLRGRSGEAKGRGEEQGRDGGKGSIRRMSTLQEHKTKEGDAFKCSFLIWTKPIHPHNVSYVLAEAILPKTSHIALVCYMYPFHF